MRISFHTFGCRLNQSETAAIQNSFGQAGHQVVGLNEPSDIVVINTCTVTEGGDADTRHLVNKVNRLNPGARIALVGCQAQIQKEKLANLPNVQWIVGNGRKMDLVSVLNEFPSPTTAQLVMPGIGRGPFTAAIASLDPGHTRANIKIQDGCDFFCSFCEIPYARGRARSRVFEDVLKEAASLVSAGHKELILTGINIGTFLNQDKTLVDVIKSIAAIEGLGRLRISSIEPTTIPKEILTCMTKGQKLCRHLHVPLQSGNDEILRKMKRKYTINEFSEFVRTAQALVPQICIGTDVIVGFPGESEAHFQQTTDILRKLPVHYFHVFSYSPRATAQSRLMKTLPAHIISSRSQILRELSNVKRRIFHESLLGSTQHVLFEKPYAAFQTKHGQNGLTDNYVRVKVKDHGGLFNQFLPVHLYDIDGQVVVGKLVH